MYYDLDASLNTVIANNARQTKDNCRFTVDNSSKPIQLIGTMLISKLTLNLLLWQTVRLDSPQALEILTHFAQQPMDKHSSKE